MNAFIPTQSQHICHLNIDAQDNALGQKREELSSSLNGSKTNDADKAPLEIIINDDFHKDALNGEKFCCDPKDQTLTKAKQISYKNYLQEGHKQNSVSHKCFSNERERLETRLDSVNHVHYVSSKSGSLPNYFANVESISMSSHAFENSISNQAGSSTQQQCQLFLGILIKFDAFMASIYALCFFAIDEQISYFYLLGFLGLAFTVQITRNLFNIRDNINNLNKNTCLELLGWFSLFILVFASLVRLITNNLVLTPFVIPGYAFTFLFWRLADHSFIYMKKSIAIIFQVLFWTQIFLILLKVDGYISSWTLVFLLLSYFFVFLMSLSAGCFLLALAYICQGFHMEERRSHSMIGLIWDFLNMMFSWIWGFTVFSITAKLEEGYSPLMAPCMLVGFLHVVVLGIYTKIFFNILKNHILRLGESPKALNEKRFKFETVKEHVLYLVRVSSIYFIRIGKGVKGQNKFDKKVKPNQDSRQIELENHYQLRNETNSVMSKKKAIFNLSKGSSVGTNHTINLRDKVEKSFHNNLAPNTRNGQQEIQNYCLNSRESDNEIDENNCLLCFLNPSNAVLMECGHGGICFDCAIQLWQKGDCCLFCRQYITEILKISILPDLNLAEVIEGTKKNVIND